MYQISNLASLSQNESPAFWEGMVLCANINTQPLSPLTWLQEFIPEQALQSEAIITQQITEQYALLMSQSYDVLSLLGGEEALADFAEGFMTLWPTIEPSWQKTITDGTQRMLQGLLTTLMLAIDEEQTHEQMKLAGIEQPPTLSEMKPNLAMMIHEVASAADELLQGAKQQAVNPYKEVGRNHDCPCGSGKKFKHCCGQS